MPLGAPGRPRQKLGVIPMALILVAAAFLGSTLGLVWQSSGIGAEKAEEDAADNAETAPAVSEDDDASADDERPRPPVSG